MSNSNINTHLVDMVFPADTNHHVTLFGGAALSHMDKVAFVAATRYGRTSFVTASCERIDFAAPAQQGFIVDLSAEVVRVGRKSMSVQVDLMSEDLQSGEQVLCTRGTFNMVAVDTEQNLPPLEELQATPEKDPSVLRMVEMVFADITNHYGTLFGGNGLAMMGKAAFIAATRHSRKVMVMAAVQQTDFEAPILEGEIVDLSAKVIKVGRTSLTVEVEMWAENLLSGERRKSAISEFVMVSVDKKGNTLPL